MERNIFVIFACCFLCVPALLHNQFSFCACYYSFQFLSHQNQITRWYSWSFYTQKKKASKKKIYSVRYAFVFEWTKQKHKAK